MWSDQSSGVSSLKSLPLKIPTLFTKISISLGSFLIKLLILDSSEKSAVIPFTFGLFSSEIASLTLLSVLPLIITEAPSFKKSFAVSKPIPFVDPDINTFLFLRFKSTRNLPFF